MILDDSGDIGQFEISNFQHLHDINFYEKS